MNKTELIEHIAKQADISKAAATRALESLGLPLQAVGLLIAVDWFTGILRTFLNVNGDTFVAMLVANEVARQILTTDQWVSFKVWGVTGATFVFALAQAPLLQRYGTKPEA